MDTSLAVTRPSLVSRRGTNYPGQCSEHSHLSPNLTNANKHIVLWGEACTCSRNDRGNMFATLRPPLGGNFLIQQLAVSLWWWVEDCQQICPGLGLRSLNSDQEVNGRAASTRIIVTMRGRHRLQTTRGLVRALLPPPGALASVFLDAGKIRTCEERI